MAASEADGEEQMTPEESALRQYLDDVGHETSTERLIAGDAFIAGWNAGQEAPRKLSDEQRLNIADYADDYRYATLETYTVRQQNLIAYVERLLAGSSVEAAVEAEREAIMALCKSKMADEDKYPEHWNAYPEWRVRNYAIEDCLRAIRARTEAKQK